MLSYTFLNAPNFFEKMKFIGNIVRCTMLVCVCEMALLLSRIHIPVAR